jgi:hypothetical protein
MTEESAKPSNKKNNHPVFNFVLSAFMLIVAVVWFFKGEVILPNKGVFLYGTQARAVAALVFLFAVWPLVLRLWNARKR